MELLTIYIDTFEDLKTNDDHKRVSNVVTLR